MSDTDIAIQDEEPRTRIVDAVTNPFQRARSPHLNEGAVAIESERAIAEAQGKLILAKRFPRDEGMAFDRVMEACSRPGLASIAFYKYKRSGGPVEGPSIRLAEEIQRCWWNMESGLRELSRKPGVSEMEAFAWDYETNNLSSQRFTVRHIRDRTEGNVDLTSERDIYEITANMGQRRVRARILAVLPSDLVDAAVHQCKKTLAGDTKVPLADRIKAMIVRFKENGVTADMLGEHLGHALDATTPDEIVHLTGIYNSLKDGDSKVADWFGGKGNGADKPPSKLDVLDKGAPKGPSADKPNDAPAPAEAQALIDAFNLCETVEAITDLASDKKTQAQMADLGKRAPAEKKRVVAAIDARREFLRKDAAPADLGV